MVRIAAYVFGILLLVFGLLGFFPMMVPARMQLELFHLNAVHNIIHIAMGIIALTVSSISAYASRLFFRILGFAFLGISVVGFFAGDKPIFAMLSSNPPNIALHVAIAIAALFLGFAFVSDEKK